MSISLDIVKAGQSLPTRTHTATNVSLFVYNAAVWNPHRIHYDAAYTTEIEGHPGIVIDGPLQGDWLSQVALNWAAQNWAADAARVTRFSYSNRRAAYLGEILTSGGQVTNVNSETGEISLALWIKNEAGEIITPGTACIVVSR